MSPIAKISHTAFHELLTEQPWPFWAIDTSTLAPLVAYHPVPATKLLRILRSHYTYSDLYLFKPSSDAEQIAAIDWRHLPQADVFVALHYVISKAVGQPFLGFAGSLDAAISADIILLLPAENETPLLLI